MTVINFDAQKSKLKVIKNDQYDVNQSLQRVSDLFDGGQFNIDQTIRLIEIGDHAQAVYEEETSEPWMS